MHTREDTIRDEVREHYGKVARGGAGCCGGGGCGGGGSQALGYSEAERSAVPEGADLGLGCGNPQAIAELSAGETVLDLGSGAGFDCLLAAQRVGPTGRVIGVDMTPEMIAKARANAERVGAAQVEFRLGEIERLPLPDRSVDVILSNCVVNLSPDKAAVFREALRVLRPGGRLAIMDVLALGPMPDALRERAGALSACIAGAARTEEVAAQLREAGFVNVRIETNPASAEFVREWLPGSGAENYLVSASIRAERPRGEGCCGTSKAAPCC